MGGVYAAQKPSTASGEGPAHRSGTRNCGGHQAPPPTTSVHAIASTGLVAPPFWESTYSAASPPTRVCFASSLCDGSRHERQRHGGGLAARYASSCMYCGSNWQACTLGQRPAAPGIESAVDKTSSCPSTITQAGRSAGSGGAV